MSRVIRISETTYRRLEQHVSSFEDNPDTVIQKLLDYYENENGQMSGRQQPQAETGDDTLMLDPSDPGDLTHTKVLEGYFGEEKVSNWKQLLHAAHSIAYRRLGSLDELSKVTHANIAEGKRTESGFDPVLGTPFSIQGANANKSWESAFRLARELKLQVAMTFRWRNKRKALHPGREGILSWSPNSLPEEQATGSSTKTQEPAEDEVLLTCEGRGARAKAKYMGDGSLNILQGSTAALRTTDGARERTEERRQELRRKGVLKTNDDGTALVFMRDEEFDSPSPAARVVLGRSANGREEWETRDGCELKEIQA